MNLKNKIRSLTNNLQCLPWKILSKTNIYKDKSSPIKYVSEEANWAIKNVGESIKREVDKITPHKFELCTNPAKLTNKIVHFGSQYMWLNWEKYLSSRNKYIVSFFHGKPEDGKEVQIHIDKFLESVQRLHKVVTASTLVEKRLLDWGVPSHKLVKIPLGTNTDKFNLPINI